ncbi:hypothetical protein WICPIJ_006091 [Wickerhamomyces pijperi]|uniref:Uncharacterized protein n=1 Tax=Wickerhamomyces pijperi TaxID=599730 RepID=A0A9P8Q2F4_WICPI|nr:hypothetical protein WICPIJ_006091 [Wickerhamomyces pijperi]
MTLSSNKGSFGLKEQTEVTRSLKFPFGFMAMCLRILPCNTLHQPCFGPSTLATLPSPLIKAVSPPIISLVSDNIKTQTICGESKCQVTTAGISSASWTSWSSSVETLVVSLPQVSVCGVLTDKLM